MVRSVGKDSKHLCHAEDVNLDGDLDMLYQLEKSQLELEAGEGVLTLRAQTLSGAEISGRDTVRVQ